LSADLLRRAGRAGLWQTVRTSIPKKRKRECRVISQFTHHIGKPFLCANTDTLCAPRRVIREPNPECPRSQTGRPYCFTLNETRIFVLGKRQSSEVNFVFVAGIPRTASGCSQRLPAMKNQREDAPSVFEFNSHSCCVDHDLIALSKNKEELRQAVEQAPPRMLAERVVSGRRILRIPLSRL